MSIQRLRFKKEEAKVCPSMILFCYVRCQWISWNIHCKLKKEKKNVERKNKKTEKKEFLNNLKAGSGRESQCNCKMCDDIFLNFEDLRMHIENRHLTHSSFVDRKVQVKEKELKNDDTIKKPVSFKDFECFYSDYNIVNQEHLTNHFDDCHGLHNTTFRLHANNPKVDLNEKQPNLTPRYFPPISPNHLSFPFGFPSVFAFPFSNL